MVKKLFCLVLLVVVIFPVFAKGGDAHDDDICALFCDIAYAEAIKNSSFYMQALNYAAFLTLDYNSNPNYYYKGTKAFDFITNRLSVPFNFTLEQLHQSGIDGGSDHEKVSHMGWEPYGKYNDATYDIWLKRKEILIKTVNKIFSFSFLDEKMSTRKLQVEQTYHPQRVSSKDVDFIDRMIISSKSKAYSFAAIIYYTHILGDIENNSGRTADTRLSLSELCTDMSKHLQIVFGSKIRNSGVGKQLLEKLKEANDAAMLMKYLQSAMQELIPEERFYKNSALASEIGN